MIGKVLLLIMFFTFSGQLVFAQEEIPTRHFASFAHRLEDFRTFGQVELVPAGLKITPSQQEPFAALSPLIEPPTSGQDYSFQAQFELNHFDIGDQFEFRFLFSPDGSYQSVVCQKIKVESYSSLHCLLKDSHFPPSSDSEFFSFYNYRKPAKTTEKYSLNLVSDQHHFRIQIWTTDQGEFGDYIFDRTFFHNHFYFLSSTWPPAFVLQKEWLKNPTASLTLNQFYYDHAYYFDQLDIWPLAQTNPVWQNEILGQTDQTSQPQTIGEIGCALTSAAMIFNYHRYFYLPSGEILDPSNLNRWLIAQKDGYINKNLLNWQALVRLSTQLHKKYYFGEGKIFPKFEYQVIKPKSFSTLWAHNVLRDKLDQRQPLIIEMPGHFLVSSGIDGLGTLLVKDPFYTDRQTSKDYQLGLSIQSLRFLKPSLTDQSYFIINILGQASVHLKDETGETIVLEKVPLFAPDINPDGYTEKIGDQYYLSQPADGLYSLAIDPPQGISENKFSFFVYNSQGEVATFLDRTEEKNLRANGEVIHLQFHKQPEVDFAIFTDLKATKNSWEEFSDQLDWPWQYVKLQFTYLIKNKLFTLAEVYRQDYFERSIINSSLNKNLRDFWQDQL